MFKLIGLLVASCLVCALTIQAFSLDDLAPIDWAPLAEGEVDMVPVGAELPRSPGSSESNESVERCAAPNMGGLQPLLREIRPLIPAERIKRMVRSALKWDPQMRSLQQLARTPNFRSNVRALRLSPEFARLRSVVCQRMYLSLEQYAKFVRTLFHVKTSQDSVELWDSDEAIFNGRPGFVGLCQDIIDVLPRTQLSSIYRRRLQSDIDLSNAINFMKSADFRQLLSGIRSRREYQDLQRMVNATGIRMSDLKKVINYALGREDDNDSNEEMIYLLTL